MNGPFHSGDRHRGSHKSGENRCSFFDVLVGQGKCGILRDLHDLCLSPSYGVSLSWRSRSISCTSSPTRRGIVHSARPWKCRSVAQENRHSRRPAVAL